MSDFAKVVMPLIERNLKLDDFTDESGFVDVYTEDPDRPYDYRSIYFVVNDEVRNALSIDRARRFANSINIYGSYTKTMNNTQCIVYRFNMPPKVMKLKNGIISLPIEDKAKIIDFWGAGSNIGKRILANGIISVDTTQVMPVADNTRIFLQELF